MRGRKKYLDQFWSLFRVLTVIFGVPGDLLVRPRVPVAEGLLPHGQELPQVVVGLQRKEYIFMQDIMPVNKVLCMLFVR